MNELARRRPLKFRRLLPLVAILVAIAPGARGAEDANALLADARKALAEHDGGAALDLANKAVAADESNVQARAFRAGLLDTMGQLEQSLADYDKLIELQPEDANAHQRRGIARFKLGQFKESVADFDKELKLRPAGKPYHWQRGIALYYAGDYKAGREQFELHKTVNPGDVENAAWHFLCVAKESGVDAARKALIPVVGDSRIPMAKIHDLFAGTANDDDVMRAAIVGNPDPDELKDRLFYAHLYVGLYHEAIGDAAGAKQHIDLAATNYRQNHYMGWVARVHAKLLEKPAPPAKG